MANISVNGVSLYYEEHGAGEPILGIHGTGSSSALWSDAAATLGTRGRTIVYDRRGFGSSERPEPFVTDVHQQADDAAALIDALAAAPAIVIGRSQGGEIAVDLALRYPDRVRALALLEGGGLSLSAPLMQWVADLDARIFAAADEDPNSVAETLPARRPRGCGLGGDARVGHGDLRRERPGDRWPQERGGLLDVTVDQLGTIDRPTLLARRRGVAAGLRRGDERRRGSHPAGEGRVGRRRAPDRCGAPGASSRSSTKFSRRSAYRPAIVNGSASAIAARPQATFTSSASGSSHCASALIQNSAPRPVNAVASSATRPIARPHVQIETERSPSAGRLCACRHTGRRARGQERVKPLACRSGGPTPSARRSRAALRDTWSGRTYPRPERPKRRIGARSRLACSSGPQWCALIRTTGPPTTFGRDTRQPAREPDAEHGRHLVRAPTPRARGRARRARARSMR